MPLALNQTLVGVFYDSGGNYTGEVHADNDDFRPHMRPGQVLVTMAKPSYDALPPALNINGFANPYDLNKALQPLVAQMNPAIGLALQAKIDAVTALLNPIVIPQL